MSRKKNRTFSSILLREISFVLLCNTKQKEGHMKTSFPSDRSQLECESYPGLQFLPCSFRGLQVSGNLSQVLLRKISLCYLRSFTEMSQNTSLISSGWSLLARDLQIWVEGAQLHQPGGGMQISHPSGGLQLSWSTLARMRQQSSFLLSFSLKFL